MKLIVDHIICVFGIIPELHQAWSSFFNNFLGKSPPTRWGCRANRYSPFLVVDPQQVGDQPPRRELPLLSLLQNLANV
jgi:hypothetical protein